MSGALIVPAAILGLWAVLALGAPLVAPYHEGTIVATTIYAPPSSGDWLGTDYLGRDLLSRIIYGARFTLGLSLLANLVALLAGIGLGFTAAALRGAVDEILGRIDDAFMAIPSIMLALISISALGSSAAVLVLTVGFIEATRAFRVARSVAVGVYNQEFVDVARARGESTWWILLYDVLPNALPPLMTDFGLRFTSTIMLISALSFLGLGVQPPQADWGMLVRENLGGIQFGAAAALLPALAIFSVTLSTNMLVDWNASRSQRDVSRELIA